MNESRYGGIMEELDLFFDQVKEITMEEFERKFTSLVENNENRNVIIDILIQYCSDYRKQLNIQKERADRETAIKLDIDRKRYKGFINYLKGQYNHKSKVKRPKVGKNCDYQFGLRNKSTKGKNKFDKEIIVLSNTLLNENNILLYLKNHSINLETATMVCVFLKYKNKKNIKRKRYLVKEKNYSQVNKVVEIIKNIIKVISEVEIYIDYLGFMENQNVQNDTFLALNNLKMLLQQLQIAEDKTHVLSDIINLYQGYINQKKKEYYEFLFNREKIFDCLSANYSQDKIEQEYLLEIEKLKIRIVELEREYFYYSHLLTNELRGIQEKGNIEFAKEMEISPVQESIKDCILRGKEISGFEMTDILYALGNCIKYEDIYQYLLEYAKDVTIKIVYEEIREESVIDAIYYVWDTIKYRLSNIPKDEVESRKILKDIRILFDFTIKNYQESDQIKNHDYLFHLVDYFLKEEDYFLYLKKIVEAMPNIVNTRYINRRDHLDEHVVLYIVDQFIKNYRIMLYDRKGNYVNKDYLKSVYFLFTRCYMLYLTEEEKNLINFKLASFMREVNKNITSSRRKYAVKEDLREMYTDKFYMNQKLNRLEYVDEYDLENYLNGFFPSIKDTLKYRRNLMDYTEEMTFTLGKGYHAYSIEREDNHFILKVHVIDLYHSIPIPSLLSKYIFNQTATNSSIDNIIVRSIDMAKDELYPTITYEITIDENVRNHDESNRVTDLKIYPSKIKVDRKYSDYDLIYSNKDNAFRLCLDLYRKLLIRNCGEYHDDYFLKDVEGYFEEVLNQSVVEYFQGHQLPFIYGGTYRYSEKGFVHIMNNVGHILSRLDRKAFNQIYKALSSNVDSFHYSTEKFDGDYQLSIMNPLSYPGLLIQKVLHELVFENRHTEEEYERAVQKFSGKFDLVVACLNYHLGYIDPKTLQDNKGQLVKVKTMFIGS